MLLQSHKDAMPHRSTLHKHIDILRLYHPCLAQETPENIKIEHILKDNRHIVIKFKRRKIHYEVRM